MEYTNLSHEHFEELAGRYQDFLYRLEKVDMKPINVYKPLPKERLDELAMIREMSKDFQKKKDDDLMRAAQAAKEAEKVEEEKKEEKPEDEAKKEE